MHTRGGGQGIKDAQSVLILALLHFSVLDFADLMIF